MAQHSTPSVYVIKGAQLINGIWIICLKSEYARHFLIEGEYSLQIRNQKIPIYEKYPIVSRRPLTEKVLFNDILFHMSDEDLPEYIYSQPNIKIKTKRVIPAQIKNHKRELIPFLSGDRFIYFRRVLPTISIINQKVRVLHHSQDLACSRCRFLGHSAKTQNLVMPIWKIPM